MIPNRHRWVLLAGMLALVVGSAWCARPAAAHDELLDSTPGKDAEVAAMPNEVTLRFGGTPLGIGATVIVADAEGGDWAAGEPFVSGDTVTVPVRDGAPDGFYQVRWRIVSGDGAVVSGHFGFAAGDTSKAEPIPPPRSDDAAAQRPPGADAAGDFALNEAVPLPGAEPTSASNSTTSPLRIVAAGVLGALAALGLAALTLTLWGRRPGQERPTTITPDPVEGT